MATEKFLKAKGYTVDELNAQLAETESQYQKLKFDHALKGLENPLSLREIRRDIARLKTEVNRRRIADMSPEQLALRTKKVSRRRKNK